MKRQNIFNLNYHFITRRLAHSGGSLPKDSLRLQAIDDNDISTTKKSNATFFATRDQTDENEERRGSDEVDDDVPILNVTDEDSPYALINKFFPDRELNHRRMQVLSFDKIFQLIHLIELLTL